MLQKNVPEIGRERRCAALLAGRKDGVHHQVVVLVFGLSRGHCQEGVRRERG